LLGQVGGWGLVLPAEAAGQVEQLVMD